MGAEMFGGVIFAANQRYHQKFDPFLISKNLWLIFMEMKQKNISFFEKKNQNGRLKKSEFFKIANSQYFLWFYGLVIGLVLLNDAQGIDVA